MKSDIVKFLFLLTVLVFACAAEMCLPEFGGVGFPVLLTVTILASRGSGKISWILTAVAAGAFEDAVSSLPFASSISFFLLTAFGVRVAGAPVAVTVLAYPFFQLWAGVLSPGGNSFGRFAVAFPMAALTLAVVTPLFGFFRRKVGLDA